MAQITCGECTLGFEVDPNLKAQVKYCPFCGSSFVNDEDDKDEEIDEGFCESDL